jgi:hypothetical protein
VTSSLKPSVPNGAFGGELVGWRKIYPAVIAIAIGFILFSSTGRDDSHITYWAAHTLSTRGEILNYNGDRVEQSSSLAHVALLAALTKILPLHLPTIGPLVSIASGGLAIVLTQSLAAAVDPRISLLAGLLTGFSASLMYWSFGGLETTLTASLGVALLLVYIRCLNDRKHRHATWQACSIVFLYLLVRPESMVVLASVLLGGVALLGCRIALFKPDDADQGRDALWFLLRMLAIAVAMSGCIVMLRLAYFGSGFPQPVAAKAAGLTRTALRDGATYLARQIYSGYGVALWLLATSGMALALYRALVAPRFSAPATLVALFAFACTAFTVLAGGDWMEGGRFLVPMVPMISILALLCLQRATHRFWAMAGLLLLCLQIGGTLALASNGSTGGPLWTTARRPQAADSSVSWFDTANGVHRNYLGLLPHVEEIVRRIPRRDGGAVTFMSCQMGTMPYYLALAPVGRLRFIDMCALVTRDFTACPVTTWLPKNRYGLRLSLEFFFQYRQQLLDRCHIDSPDMIFEFDRMLSSSGGRKELLTDFLKRNGYSIAYQQRAREFVAVRNDRVE